MKKLLEFSCQLTVRLDGEQRRQAFEALNLHWFGDKNCSEYNSEGKLVDKFPNHKNRKKHQNSHYDACKSQIVNLQVALMEDGSLRLIPPPSKELGVVCFHCGECGIQGYDNPNKKC